MHPIIDLNLRRHAAKLAGPVASARARFQELHPGRGPGLPSPYDYARFSFVYERSLATQGSVLDVGVGSGQLLEALACGGHFSRACGIDLSVHPKFSRFRKILSC